MDREKKYLKLINKYKDKGNFLVDEMLNFRKVKRHIGSGCYSGLMFFCSKCGKLYTSYGALKYYHKQCGPTRKDTFDFLDKYSFKKFVKTREAKNDG